MKDDCVFMMKYAIVICPQCTTAKVVESKFETTSCIRCGKRLIVKKLKIQYQTNSLEDARQIIGQINAEKDGQLDTFKSFLKN